MRSPEGWGLSSVSQRVTSNELGRAREMHGYPLGTLL